MSTHKLVPVPRTTYMNHHEPHIWTTNHIYMQSYLYRCQQSIICVYVCIHEPRTTYMNHEPHIYAYAHIHKYLYKNITHIPLNRIDTYVCVHMHIYVVRGSYMQFVVHEYTSVICSYLYTCSTYVCCVFILIYI